jgi:hypothetical protein
LAVLILPDAVLVNVPLTAEEVQVSVTAATVT